MMFLANARRLNASCHNYGVTGVRARCESAMRRLSRCNSIFTAKWWKRSRILLAKAESSIAICKRCYANAPNTFVNTGISPTMGCGKSAMSAVITLIRDSCVGLHSIEFLTCRHAVNWTESPLKNVKLSANASAKKSKCVLGIQTSGLTHKLAAAMKST